MDLIIINSMAHQVVIEVVREYHFEAAHTLAWHPGKCSRIHGHSYRLEAAVGGELDQRGVVQEFGELDQVVQPLIETLDHCDLGTVVDNPTAERIATWLFERIEAETPGLTWIRLWETARSSVVVRA